MFAVLYIFDVIPGKEKEFKKSWSDLTKLIYKYEGSLGSRLHIGKENQFIAYAQWPDKNTWKQAGDNLPPETDQVRQMMKDSCHSITTQHELQVEEDLTKKETFEDQ